MSVEFSPVQYLDSLHAPLGQKHVNVNGQARGVVKGALPTIHANTSGAVLEFVGDSLDALDAIGGNATDDFLEDYMPHFEELVMRLAKVTDRAERAGFDVTPLHLLSQVDQEGVATELYRRHVEIGEAYEGVTDVEDGLTLDGIYDSTATLRHPASMLTALAQRNDLDLHFRAEIPRIYPSNPVEAINNYLSRVRDYGKAFPDLQESTIRRFAKYPETGIEKLQEMESDIYRLNRMYPEVPEKVINNFCHHYDNTESREKALAGFIEEVSELQELYPEYNTTVLENAVRFNIDPEDYYHDGLNNNRLLGKLSNQELGQMLQEYFGDHVPSRDEVETANKKHPHLMANTKYLIKRFAKEGKKVLPNIDFDKFNYVLLGAGFSSPVLDAMNVETSVLEDEVYQLLDMRDTDVAPTFQEMLEAYDDGALTYHPEAYLFRFSKFCKSGGGERVYSFWDFADEFGIATLPQPPSPESTIQKTGGYEYTVDYLRSVRDWLAGIIGKAPRQADWVKAQEMSQIPVHTTVYHRFDSWDDFISS